MHSVEQLEEMQRLPLSRKIQITTARIIEWYQHYIVYCLYPEIWEKAKLAENAIGYSILKQGFLSDFEVEFAKLKEKALLPTEKTKPQKFWAVARKLIKDDDNLPCECSF